MSNISPIAKQDQLEAIATGLSAVYKLISDHVGDLNKIGDVRRFITISKEELISYLREHRELTARHIFSPNSSKYHEQPVVEWDGRVYRVYEMDHNNPRYMREFDDMEEAVAEYLLWRWK